MRDLADSTTAQQGFCCWIKKTAACLMSTLPVGGCWAPSIQSSGSKLDRLRTVLIVPVESPPLEVIPDLLEQRAGYQLPLTDASHSAHLHRWYEAIQTWYGQEQTAVDYGWPGCFDAVLELGIGSYRIFEGQTSLQILIKLIDPSTRRVIARSRADNFRVDDEALASVDRGGEPFKQLIGNMSLPLLRQGLGDIGLSLQARLDG